MPTLMFAPRINARSRVLFAGGERVHLLEAGPKDGAPILLVHGASGGAGWWWRNVDALVRAGRRVVLPDLPGFGESSRPAGSPAVSIAWYGRLIGLILDGLRIERADVVGLSLGGGASLSFSLEQPERVHRLVLVAAAGLGPEIALPFRLLSVPLLGEVLATPHPQLLRRFHADYLYGQRGRVDEEMLSYEYASAICPGSKETLLSLLRPPLPLWTRLRGGQGSQVMVERLGELRPKTLLVWGRNDRIIPVAHALRAAQRIPKVELELLADAGHMPHFENPERFARALGSFLGVA